MYDKVTNIDILHLHIQELDDFWLVQSVAEQVEIPILHHISTEYTV